MSKDEQRLIDSLRELIAKNAADFVRLERQFLAARERITVLEMQLAEKAELVSMVLRHNVELRDGKLVDAISTKTVG